ncbi:MAG: alpha-galactosidase [Capsulimonadaceae bacterium]|nr:alpha-galactosidase [Capsulimonadaceae bacterium]
MTTSGYSIDMSEIEFVRKRAETFASDLPIDFTIGAERAAEFVSRNGLARRDEDGARAYVSRDPATGFAFEVSIKTYDDFPVCEWRLSFENRGDCDSAILSDVNSLSLTLQDSDKPKPIRLVRSKGAFEVSGHAETYPDNFRESFMPVEDTLENSEDIEFGARAGRSSDPWLPFFGVELPEGDGGLIFAIGWAAQWRASVTPRRVVAGIEGFHAKLLPGEKIAVPSIYMLRYEGRQILRGQNILRRFLREKIAPQYDGKPITPPISTMAWGGITEEEHLKRIEFLKAHPKLKFDAYWIDAGWYAPPSNSEHEPLWWQFNGEYRFNPDILPHGLRPVADAAKRLGMKFLLWVEPERAVTGTRLPNERPEWYLGERKENGYLLLNMGNPEAVDWCIDYISSLIEKEGVDFYREDFNTDPLPFWRSNDAPDRQGITEVKAIAGLYRFWSELRRRFPHLMIDTCASGGRRIEIELLRYSVPLWSSDMQCFPGFNPDYAQTHVSGLSYWLPLFGNGCQNHEGGDTYNFRSTMGAAVNMQQFYQRSWFPMADDYPIDWLKARIDEFHAVKDCMSGDYYPLIRTLSHSDEIWSASQFDRPDLHRGVLFAFRRPKSSFTTADLRLYGLAPDALYELHDFDSGNTWTQAGRDLIDTGLCIEMREPRSSRLISYIEQSRRGIA